MNTKRAPKVRFKGFTDAWEQRKLGELVDVCSGRDYKHLSEGDIPVYGTGGYMLNVSEALSYDKDAIGIGRKGTIDKPYILNAPFWTVDTLFYAIPKEKVDLNFAFDIFQNINWKKKDESTGVPSLSRTAINEIHILVPQYDEQQVLGQLFYGIDRLIALHQRKLDKMKELKKAFLNLIFSQKLRFYGFEDKWKKEKLKNVLKISNERNKNNLFSKNDVISVSREAGTVNQIEYQGRSFAGNDISNYKVIKPGDLIYTKSPLKDAPYGIFQEATIIGIVSPLYAVYKSTDRVFAPFVAMLLKNDSNSTQYLSPLVSKGAKNTINISDAGALDGNLFFPKIEEQKKFYLLYTKINKTIIFHQKKLDNLKDLKKVLLRNMLI